MNNRLLVILLVVYLIMGVFVSRLWQLQVVQHQSYALKSQGNTLRYEAILPPRGRLFDRNGKLIATNRLAVASPASLFNHAGAGHQMKLNKASTAQTAAILFQTNFSGRAELVTLGNNNFALKVSGNGTSYTTALEVNATSAGVELFRPVLLTGQSSPPASPANGHLWHDSTRGQLMARIAGQSRMIDQQADIPCLVPPSGEYVSTTMGSGGVTVRTDEEGREEIPEDFITLLDRLAVKRVTKADDRELRGDIGAVDLSAEAGAEPGEEIADMIDVRVGEEEGMKGRRRHREAFDSVDRLVAFALEQTAIDREALAAGGMIDEVRGAGDGTTGTEGLIEERRRRERVMGRQAELHGSRHCGDNVGGLSLVEAKRRDGLRRVEQLGEFVQVGHKGERELFGTTAHARP